MDPNVITPATLPVGGYVPPTTESPAAPAAVSSPPQEFRATQEMAGLVEYHNSLEAGRHNFLLKSLEVSMRHLQNYPRDQVNAAFTTAGLITPFTVTYYDFVGYPNDVKLIIYNFLLTNKVVKDLNNPEAPEKLISEITKYFKYHKCPVCKQLGHTNEKCPVLSEMVCKTCGKIGHKVCCASCGKQGHATAKCYKNPQASGKQAPEQSPSATNLQFPPAHLAPNNLTQLFPPTSFDPLIARTAIAGALQIPQQPQHFQQPQPQADTALLQMLLANVVQLGNAQQQLQQQFNQPPKKASNKPKYNKNK